MSELEDLAGEIEDYRMPTNDIEAARRVIHLISGTDGCRRVHASDKRAVALALYHTWVSLADGEHQIAMAYMFILTKRYCARARLDWEEVATVARGML